MVARPSDPAGEARPGPMVPILTVPQRPQCKVAVPLKPAPGLNQTAHVSVHVNRPRVLFPRPTQIGWLRGQDLIGNKSSHTQITIVNNNNKIEKKKYEFHKYSI